MKPHEIYKAVDPALITQMLDWFRSNDKNVYKHTLATLANARKLRPVFVAKKSMAEQYKWIMQTLQLRASDTLGEHLLQAWFMAGHQAMLGTFCDALGILHDGKGSIHGDLPKVLDDTRLDAGIEKLLADNEPKIVALYLHVFNMQQEGGWENLSQRLASNANLALA
jgi:hypothetical protein